MPRIAVVLAGLALILVSCAGPDSSAQLLEQEPVSSASLPPVTTPPTTTTTTTSVPPLPVDPETADRTAQSELRSALVAARAVYADRGSYDAPLSEIGRFAPEVVFIELTEAYSVSGVAYDPHDQRVTLHRRSESGRWFCIDEHDRTGTDFGFGDSFEASLATCTDGTKRADWSTAFDEAPGGGDDYEPIGPDEAAILHAFERFTDAVDEADHEALRATVFESTGCSTEALASFWPDGLDLFDAVTFDIEDMAIEESFATVSVTILGQEVPDWHMIRYGIEWYHDQDPCPLLEPEAVEPQNAAARQLLVKAHIASQTAFVRSEDFSLTLDALNAVDPSITFVALEEAEHGYAGYAGTREHGLMVTEGAPGQWYCIVEYLRENTGFGVGSALEDVATAASCNQSTEDWPEPK